MGHDDFCVEIKMFGEFDILVDNKSLFNEFTRLPIIMELLQYMIANYGEEISPNKILNDIWSDKDYQDISKVLRTYIYRLKQFLASNNSLEVDISKYISISNSNGRYRLNVSEDCSLDIRLFDSEIKKLDHFSKDIESIEAIKNIASIYRGDFLKNNLYNHWVIPLRSLYLDYFSKLTNIVLETYYNNQLYKEVIRYSEQIFEIYDLDEKANVYFLNSLINEGRSSDALQHYSYITSKLYTELHIKPCEELKEIYTILKKPIISEISQKKIIKEVPSIAYVQNAFMSRLPRNFKKYKLFNKQDIAIGLFKVIHLSGELVLREESEKTYNILKEVLSIILIKDYYFNHATNDVFVLFIRDAKESFVSLVSEQLKNYIAINQFSGDINLEVEIKMVSPLRREKNSYDKESIKYENGQ